MVRLDTVQKRNNKSNKVGIWQIIQFLREFNYL
jgi:hypothetical protein